MLVRTDETVTVSAEGRDEFILMLNDAMMSAGSLREKLFHTLVKECGVRWTEIMVETLDEASDPDEFAEKASHFMVASLNFNSWMIDSLLNRLIGEEDAEPVLDQMLADLRRDVLRVHASRKKREATGE